MHRLVSLKIVSIYEPTIDIKKFIDDHRDHLETGVTFRCLHVLIVKLLKTRFPFLLSDWFLIDFEKILRRSLAKKLYKIIKKSIENPRKYQIFYLF